MAKWQPQNPINVNAGGDDVYTGFVKTNSEFDAIYNRLNELRVVRASVAAPADAEQYELWLDTSTNPPKLKYFDGVSWKEIDELVGTPTPASRVVPLTLSTGVLSKGFVPFFMGFKNRIINGDFAIWQRGTSFSAAGYTADRWRYDTDTDDVVAISRSATTGSEPFDAIYYVTIALTAGTTGTFNKFSTRLEFPKLYFGKTVTLSFWAKADVATAITAKIAFVFSGIEYNPVSQSISIDTTWQRYTATFTLGTPTGFTESGSDYLDVAFLLPVNTSVTIDIANIQLEEGDVATEFEYVPYDIQLLRCMRYYEVGKQDVIYSNGWNATGAYSEIKFRVIKRAAPTITLKDFKYWSNGVDTPFTPTIAQITTTRFRYMGVGLTNWNGFDGTGTWTADAEL